jgi:hypothetical protein
LGRTLENYFQRVALDWNLFSDIYSLLDPLCPPPDPLQALVNEALFASLMALQKLQFCLGCTGILVFSLLMEFQEEKEREKRGFEHQ